MTGERKKPTPEAQAIVEQMKLPLHPAIAKAQRAIDVDLRSSATLATLEEEIRGTPTTRPTHPLPR
jgi:hypothetical protein